MHPFLLTLKRKLISLLWTVESTLSCKWWGSLRTIAQTLPPRNIILLESIPDLSDNTKAVFDEMLRRGWNRKYTLVWLLTDPASFPKPPRRRGVRYCGMYSNAAKFYSVAARAKISCNTYVRKDRPEQFCFYLSHGTAIKSLRGYYPLPPGIDRFLTASHQTVPLQAGEFQFDPARAVPLGFPRNDILCQESDVDLRAVLNTQCRKVIVWYPTFRQHKNGFKTGSSHALPILHSPDLAQRANAAARDLDILLVIKPHFVQDVRCIQDLHLSNIRFLDDTFFVQNKLSSYGFLGACDALITDYSSVYFDYTLCDKPIAAVWEDIDDYRRNPGLVEDYIYLMKGAEKIYTIEDLTAFLQRVAAGVDLLKQERNEIRDYANYAADGKNSARVVDYIEGVLT